MRRNVMAAFALSLSIVGTVISITAVVLSGCALGAGRNAYHR